jgi:hypothetical protein
LARSRPGGRRTAATPTGRELAPESPDSSSPVPSLASATLPRVWQGVGYRPLPDAGVTRSLFDFAAVDCPADAAVALVWGALARESGSERVIGAVVGERAGGAMMLHGPVVTDAVVGRADAPGGRADAPVSDPLEVAVQLVAAVLDHASALGVETVFTRPQGLDRVWVRFGFIPIPESALPESLAGRPGAGLYAWRGGSALWTFRETAGRM